MDRMQAAQILKDGVRRFSNRDDFRAFLDLRNKFHNYSWHNVVMILCQRPEASYVAGFRKWLDMKRFVKKGQKGIAIWCPMFKRGDVKAETEDKAPLVLRGFRIVYVFDISQTDGQPLPELADVPESTGGDEALMARIVASVARSGVALAWEKPPDGTKGDYTHDTRRMRVDPALTLSERITVILHELAHEHLHGPKTALPRATREIEAEAVAYLLAHSLGIKAEEQAFQYLAVWSEGKPEQIDESLDRIDAAYRVLAGALAPQPAARTEPLEVVEAIEAA